LVVDIISERWKITAFKTDGSYHAFDIESTQYAQTDLPLVIQKNHYGGTAVRGPVAWLTPDKASNASAANVGELSQDFTFLNDLGSDRMKGNHDHAKWVCMTGSSNGQPVSIAVFSHPNNFRAPQPARIHPTKPYCVFSPCVDGEFKIDREHRYHSRYRFIIADSAPKTEWLNEQWEAFIALQEP